MRIISSFRDYYDGIAQSFYDPNTLYIRKEERLQFNTENSDMENQFRKLRLHESHYSKVVDKNVYCRAEKYFIAGKLILVPTIVLQDRTYSIGAQKNKEVLVFKTTEEFFTKMDELEVKSMRYFGFTGTLDNVMDQFNGTAWRFNDLTGSPILRMHGFGYRHHGHDDSCYWEIDKDVNLFKEGFQAVMSDWEVYQEIYTWFNSVHAKKENEVVQVSNDDRIQQHGFDKHSFRKAPTKNRG